MYGSNPSFLKEKLGLVSALLNIGHYVGGEEGSICDMSQLLLPLQVCLFFSFTQCVGAAQLVLETRRKDPSFRGSFSICSYRFGVSVGTG